MSCRKCLIHCLTVSRYSCGQPLTISVSSGTVSISLRRIWHWVRSTNPFNWMWDNFWKGNCLTFSVAYTQCLAKTQSQREDPIRCLRGQCLLVTGSMSVPLSQCLPSGCITGDVSRRLSPNDCLQLIVSYRLSPTDCLPLIFSYRHENIHHRLIR